jgi:hypothetical protein
MNVQDTAEIVGAYHDAWTRQDYARARALLAGTLAVEVPVNVPVELLELSGFPQVDPVLDGRAHRVDRRSNKPSNEGHPADNGARDTMHLADEASSGADGHHRNHRTRITEPIPLRTRLVRIGSAGPNPVHEGPALQSEVQAVLAITSLCQGFVQARRELPT